MIPDPFENPSVYTSGGQKPAAETDGQIATDRAGLGVSPSENRNRPLAKGRIILNHCGVNLTPSRLDRLFVDHPNLFCEFSVRHPPVRNPKGVFTEMFNDRAIGPGWKDVIVKHADRFMVGTDAEGDNDRYVAAIQNVRSGLLANLPIDVARKVAYGNAQALFGLK